MHVGVAPEAARCRRERSAACARTPRLRPNGSHGAAFASAPSPRRYLNGDTDHGRQHRGPLGAAAAHRAAADRIGGGFSPPIAWPALLLSAAMKVRVCALVRSDVGWRALARLRGGCGIARAPWRLVSGRQRVVGGTARRVRQQRGSSAARRRPDRHGWHSVSAGRSPCGLALCVTWSAVTVRIYKRYVESRLTPTRLSHHQVESQSLRSTARHEHNGMCTGSESRPATRRRCAVVLEALL